MNDKSLRIADRIEQKITDNKLITLKEFQIHKIGWAPSSLLVEFFPKFCREQGVFKHMKLKPAIWDKLFDMAAIEHQKYIDGLVAANPPTLRIGGRNIIYKLS